MVYGGTLFQLAFPLAFCWHFCREGNALGYAFGLAWEGSSLRNVGVYMADARRQGLPLVGNGDRVHDWNDILGRWGLLQRDAALGFFTSACGWILLGAALWLLLSLWLSEEGAGR